MSHPIACVSSCMLVVACVATHGRPHALMHASFTFQETPPRPHDSQHVWGSCVATHGHWMSVRMRYSKILRHLVLLLVKLHETLIPAETCRAS
ncbi:hypothetical protein IGI04_018741 [Brassica rapa subsp. trilocularis]|uniref:Secreted protein n=1 Tax=Brassica rapa subsp. trilocularis TaxID=1813537 RepID=A0ABQ7ME94_BRACM|nr:hypothetical protein IGI04_018741 [Brassica rapa subsp. trilocularis]